MCQTRTLVFSWKSRWIESSLIFIGILWLTICFFAMKPLHRKVPIPEIIPNVVVAPEPAMALIPVPAVETTEPAPVLAR